MTNDIAATETVLITLNMLDADPKNVRKTYSKEGVAELAGTIRADGYRLLQNIIVRKADKKGRFSSPQVDAALPPSPCLQRRAKSPGTFPSNARSATGPTPPKSA